MEESSVRRKEHLLAMRMEASEGGGNPLMMVSQTLANPLIDQPPPPEPHAAPRFDYYTDPMAAFLPNKRGNNKVTHPSPAHPALISPTVQTTPNPGYFQAQVPYNNQDQYSCPAQQLNSTPELRPFQPQGQYYNPGPFRSPAQQPNYPPGSIPFQDQGQYYDPRPFQSPAQQPNYPPGSVPFQAQGPNYGPIPFQSPAQQPNYPPGSVPFQAQGPNYGPIPFRSPAQQPNYPPGSVPFQAQGSYYNPGPMGTPDAYNMPRGIVSQQGRPGDLSPNFIPNASPGLGQGGRPSFNNGRGRGYNSPQAGYHNSGRGTSSGSSCFNQSGSHNGFLAGFNAHKYCKKSMVEDPWKGLKPVLWKQSTFSWLPKSLSAKKPRVSEAPIKKESGQSLAEYLAASFHEATNETDDNDDGKAT